MDKEKIALYGLPENQNDEAYRTGGKGIRAPGVGGLNLNLMSNCLSCAG